MKNIFFYFWGLLETLYMSNISKHFEEAYQVLEAFNTESNFLKIEEAGLIMV